MANIHSQLDHCWRAYRKVRGIRQRAHRKPTILFLEEKLATIQGLAHLLHAEPKQARLVLQTCWERLEKLHDLKLDKEQDAKMWELYGRYFTLSLYCSIAQISASHPHRAKRKR